MDDKKKENRDIVTQMVDGIMSKESENITEKEKEIRKRLSDRAFEYLMFLDDDEDEAKEE